jgi:erythromycin esterase-like protein
MRDTAAAIRGAVCELRRIPDDYAAIVDFVGDARFVLLGEASHGTEEFYRHRAEITKLLIERRGFAAVAAEADWPDAATANRFALGRSDTRDASAALSGFRRFPTWMWRNTAVASFLEWLHEWNAERDEA